MSTDPTYPGPLLYPYAFLFPGQSPPPGVLLTVGPAKARALAASAPRTRLLAAAAPRTRSLTVTGEPVNLSRIDKKYADYTITATLRDGRVVTPAGVDVALLPARTSPTAATTWTTAQFSGGVATVLLAGPDADPTSALAVPTNGGDLWFRITDSPEVDAINADRITIS